MATVNFLYRSRREQAFLTLRLLFSVPLETPRTRTRYGKEIFVYYDEKVVSELIKLEVTANYWKDDHSKQRINDLKRSNYQKEVKEELSNIETFVLNEFNEVQDPATVNKDWLTSTIERYYNPEREFKAPNDLVNFFDFYIEIRKSELSKTRIKRLKVVQRKLKRYEKETKTKVFIKDVNDFFKASFINYSDKHKYSRNTLKTDFSVIKTVCTYAKTVKVQTSPQLKNLNIEAESIKAPYLSFDEIEKIKTYDFSKTNYLENARDWLIISCFTGQRVSDFMRFTSKMITQDQDGNKFLNFTQKKTKKKHTIPLLKEVLEILDKRNGAFPRPTTPERYNDYIKEVCKIVGLDEIIKGKATVCTAKDPKKATRNDYRKIIGNYEKWRLASSHIGRRSFATNYYGKLPTSVLIYITGHSTEKMFLDYIHKSDEDKAKDALKHFQKLSI